MFRKLYKYAQKREAEWHQSFNKPILTERDKKRADFFINWIDHGVLRTFWTNFHEIEPGVYRSNHPTPARMRNYANNGVNTIVNLRGASMAPYYQLEKNLCDELGFSLINLPMQANRAPSKETCLRLLDVFDTAEKPLIIHCKSGADRTSIAAALYKLHVGKPIEEAQSQFSLRYIHLKHSSRGY